MFHDHRRLDGASFHVGDLERIGRAHLVLVVVGLQRQPSAHRPLRCRAEARRGAGNIGERRGRRLDQSEHLLKADLEAGELAVDEVLGLEPDLPCLRLGRIDDPLGLGTGRAVDLGPAEHAVPLAAGPLQRLLGLPLDASEHLFTVFDDPPGLLQLARDGFEQDLEALEQCLTIHDCRRREGHGTCLANLPNDRFEVGDDIHGRGPLIRRISSGPDGTCIHHRPADCRIPLSRHTRSATTDGRKSGLRDTPSTARARSGWRE
jgi:hypothetical protein